MRRATGAGQRSSATGTRRNETGRNVGGARPTPMRAGLRSTPREHFGVTFAIYGGRAML